MKKILLLLLSLVLVFSLCACGASETNSADAVPEFDDAMKNSLDGAFDAVLAIAREMKGEELYLDDEDVAELKEGIYASLEAMMNGMSNSKNAGEDNSDDDVPRSWEEAMEQFNQKVAEMHGKTPVEDNSEETPIAETSPETTENK